jgi:hypothetical protein
MRRHAAYWLAGLTLASLGQAAFAAVTVDTLLDDLVSLQRLTKLPDPAYTTKQFSSWDRASKSFSDYQGWFANGDCAQYLRSEDNDGRKEFVMMDTDGPGAIVRIWSANPDGNLRIYLDGEAKPVIEAPMSALLGGKVKNLPAPISCEVSRGWNLYFPIPYAKHCKVTSDKGTFYYHVNYRTYAAGTEVTTMKAGDLERLASKIAETNKALAEPRTAAEAPADSKKAPFDVQLEPGAAATLLTQDGPKAICGVLVHLTAANLEEAARGVVVIMHFDGEKTVESPLGDFFGTAPGLTPYDSLPSGISKVAGGKPQDLWSHWWMPFAKNAKIEVKNLTDAKVKVEGQASVVDYKWDDQSLLFHAKWRIERDVPSRPFSDWQHLEANGAGRFVGGHLHLINNVRDWWGEGDEKIYVDGETFPSHFGTGTEDYYGYAWCSPERFVHAYHNQPRCDGPGNYGNTSVNRWHIIDDIPFTKSFRFDIENWQWNEKARNTRAAISYWYVKPKSTDFFGPIIASDVKLLPIPEVPMHRVAGAIEGEKMKIVSKTGKTEAQDMGGYGETWSGAAQLWWTQAKVDDELVLSFEAKAAGKKKVVLGLTKAPDYAVVQISVNGAKAAKPVDLYAPGVEFTEVDLGEFDLKKGENKLAVHIAGANEKAQKSYMFGLDYLLVK